MRRQYFTWSWFVLAVVLTAYGAFSLIYNHVHGKDISILGLAFLAGGVILFAVYFVLFFLDFRRKKDAGAKEKMPEDRPAEIEDKPDESVQKKETEETIPEPAEKAKRTYAAPSGRTGGPSRRESGSGYVRQVGYGPVLRINEDEVLDMRCNTYYRIEGNFVYQNGRGVLYEISGNRIRDAFGSYLFEISGSNVNKVFGGYYASFGGGYLQTHDQKEKFEVPSDLTMSQKLVVVALLLS